DQSIRHLHAKEFFMSEITMNDLLSQEVKRDPHTFYAHLRSKEPLYYIEELDTWLVTTYEDALFVLKDPRFTKDNRKIVQPENKQEAFSMRTMLMVDPPDHTRLRSLVSKAFTPRMIEQLRPRI